MHKKARGKSLAFCVGVEQSAVSFVTANPRVRSGDAGFRPRAAYHSAQRVQDKHQQDNRVEQSAGLYRAPEGE